MLTRIGREFRDLVNAATAASLKLGPVLNAEGNVDAEWVAGNKQNWRISFIGPPDTPYSGGRFVVNVHFESGYPFQPPKIKFETKVWHPNVSSCSGAICLDILKDAWSPAMNMRTTLLSLQALLAHPNADDPQDAEVASQYRNDRAAWTQKASEWTRLFAVQESEQERQTKREILNTIKEHFLFKPLGVPIQPPGEPIRDMESGLIQRVVRECGWNASAAIRQLS